MLSLESKSYLISGMSSTPAGNRLINAIQNSSALSQDDFTHLKDCLGDDKVAANVQACILGTYALSPRDVQFIKDAFSLPDSALLSVLSNLAGGVQAPRFPNFLPDNGPNQFPNVAFNSSPVNVSMPTGFSFAVNFNGPAYQQWNTMSFPAGSAFASTGAGKYFEFSTSGNAHKYYVWYSVSGGSNTDPAPAGFTGIEVVILSGDSANTVASKTNAALNATLITGLLAPATSSYAILGASAVTGSTGAGSTLTGNLGIYPNTSSSITNFPPSTYSGVENAGNAAAHAAQTDALSVFTSLNLMPATTIATELGGQSLAPGVYTAASGTFSLNGTLTLTGGPGSLYVFQTASTLITGGVSTPVMAMGAVLSGNVYWAVGSSATINSSHAGTFYGNVIAQASITDSLGGTVNGSLIALTAAVTLSTTTVVNAPTYGPAGPVMAGAAASVAGNAVTLVLAPVLS